jgi:hypothetical protein
MLLDLTIVGFLVIHQHLKLAAEFG